MHCSKFHRRPPDARVRLERTQHTKHKIDAGTRTAWPRSTFCGAHVALASPSPIHPWSRPQPPTPLFTHAPTACEAPAARSASRAPRRAAPPPTHSLDAIGPRAGRHTMIELALVGLKSLLAKELGRRVGHLAVKHLVAGEAARVSRKPTREGEGMVGASGARTCRPSDDCKA